MAPCDGPGRPMAPPVTPLGRRLIALIEASGPISVADYMAACLFDPEHGYYTTREPFGAGGDFTTAPEISQMFGELCTAWLVAAWRSMGAPDEAMVVEIGPGRGTMALDIARTLARLAPPLAERLHLVEASPRLAAVQRQRLGAAGAAATWHAGIETLPDAPRLVVANELFDAIPARQFVAAGGRWVERCVLVRDGALAFGTGAGALPGPALDASGEAVPEGTVWEVAPAREAMMGAIASQLARTDGALLAIDYGHGGGYGDTLQALRDHAPVDPLAEPGRADLTTHVDFRALAAAARASGAHVPGMMEQGAFLLAMGLLERAGALGGPLDTAGREALHDAVERLAGPDAMGALFKVLAVTGRPRPVEPFGGDAGDDGTGGGSGCRPKANDRA